MGIERVALLRNIGQFDSVTAGARLPFAKFTLAYAENGRGKTTLAAILRSSHSGDPTPISERRRLGAAHPPHVVLNLTGGIQSIFEHNAWSAVVPFMAVFDDTFIAENVCSGIEIETSHRQKLHELILGAQGVALSAALQYHVTRIEEHNRALRTKAEAIPAAARGDIPIDAFCAIPVDANVEEAIQEAERNLAAARAVEVIRQAAAFVPVQLPSFDTASINGLLGQTLRDLEAEAAEHVQAHLTTLGRNAEAWVADGMQRVANAPAGYGNLCPFCARSLDGSVLLRHYQAYFSDAYTGLKQAIANGLSGVNAVHGGDATAAFERAVRVAAQARDFWRSFAQIPEVAIDTATTSLLWRHARDAIVGALDAKQSAPLEFATLSDEAMAAVEAYEAAAAAVARVSASLEACNGLIALVKERSAAANVAVLSADLAKLKAKQARHTQPVASLCEAYLAEKQAKAETGGLRDAARDALDNYRRNIFPAYEAAINTYLQRFNAGFRLGSVDSVNNRGGSSCSYNVLINNVAVALTAATGPSFRNTLSAGDRNALALAFFFASLDQHPQLAQHIVVIDDPMTSLDEHRALTTVQEMRRLLARVNQIIVLSHSKPFLCALWEGADPLERTAIRVTREGDGSTLAAWDVRQDCITEHDRRHELVAAYLVASNPAVERHVAAALRPILEAFVRVAYPADFKPGSLLGPFVNICQQRLAANTPILSQVDMAELRDLLDFANRFHHDTNPAWEVEAINDRELAHFCSRTLAFAQRN